MLNRLQLRGNKISKYFHSIAQARPHVSTELNLFTHPEDIFKVEKIIDEEKVMNTPSRFVADKSRSVFEKYKLDKNDPFSFVELTLAGKTQLTEDTYIFKLDFPEEDKDLVMGTDVGRAIRFHKILPTKENPEGTHVKR